MQPRNEDLVNNVWINIWQFHGPVRASMTLWMLLHEGRLRFYGKGALLILLYVGGVPAGSSFPSTYYVTAPSQ